MWYEHTHCMFADWLASLFPERQSRSNQWRLKEGECPECRTSVEGGSGSEAACLLQRWVAGAKCNPPACPCSRTAPKIEPGMAWEHGGVVQGAGSQHRMLSLLELDPSRGSAESTMGSNNTKEAAERGSKQALHLQHSFSCLKLRSVNILHNPHLNDSQLILLFQEMDTSFKPAVQMPVHPGVRAWTNGNSHEDPLLIGLILQKKILATSL